MATFTTFAAAGFRMDQLNLFDLFEHNSELRLATEYRSIDDAANFTRFTGAGLTYAGVFPDTQLTGGTITGIQDIQAAATTFNLTGVSITAPALYGFYLAANTTGALSAMLNGNDTVTGAAGNDVLFGFQGDDRIVGGLGGDLMNGGIGNDTYVVDNIGDVIDEDAFNVGVDTVESSISFIMPDAVEALVLTGGAAINGTGRSSAFGIFNDTITGNNAANILDGGNGDDLLNGGLGNDTYVVDSTGDLIVDSAGTDTIRSYLNWFLSSTPAIENLVLIGNAGVGQGNALNNTITGNTFNNQLLGGAGNDVLNGLEGDDQLRDGNGDNIVASGTNTFNGGVGNDTYFVEIATDNVVELANEGYDSVWASLNYTLTANVERLFLNGFTANLNGTGNGLDNYLVGNLGNNTLNGLVGADIMRGDQGNDTYVVDNLGDRAFESTNGLVSGVAGGVDLVQSSVSFRLTAFVENLTLTGALAINGTGNDLGNVITGNGAANIIDGKQGADLMLGGAGNDVYFRDDFGDVVTDTTGIDTVNVSHGGYTLEANIENANLIGTGTIAGFGNALNNIITGNAAANSLEGNGGADTLDGRGGSDTMIGGIGADKFQFTVLAGGGTDSIFDFTSASDKIVVSAAAFGGGLVAGTILASQLVKNSAPVATSAAGVGQFLYDTDDGRLLWDANGVAAGGVTHFATLDDGIPVAPSPVLVFTDFQIIA